MDNKYFFEYPNTCSWRIAKRYVFVVGTVHMSIWKHLCDDLFPTTWNLAHYYLYYIESEYHTVVDKGNGQ